MVNLAFSTEFRPCFGCETLFVDKLTAATMAFMMSPEELKARVEECAALIETKYGPTFEEKPTRIGAGWRIAVDDAGYHLFRYDDYNYGGWEYEFLITTDLDKLLFWSFQAAVRHEARSYADIHATPGQDRRRVAHTRAIELFTRISPTCAERMQAGIELSLKTHPHDDAYESRIIYHRQNIESGVAPGDSWRWSLLKYPPPAPASVFGPSRALRSLLSAILLALFPPHTLRSQGATPWQTSKD